MPPCEAHPGRPLSHLDAGVLQSCADHTRDQALHSREPLASAKKQPKACSDPFETSMFVALAIAPQAV